MSTEREVKELVSLLLSEPAEDSVVKAHTQNFGSISLLFVYSLEYLEKEYCVFAELDENRIKLDDNNELHLIILERTSDKILKSVDDVGVMQELLDELYCRFIVEVEAQTVEEEEDEIEYRPVLDIQAAEKRTLSQKTVVSYDVGDSEVSGEVDDDLRDMMGLDDGLESSEVEPADDDDL